MTLSDDTIATITAIVVPALVALARIFFKDAAVKHQDAVEWAVGVAYNVTNEVAKHTATQVDDKVAFALGVFRDALKTKGVQASVDDEAAAKLAWKAMHGADKEVDARLMKAQAGGVSPQMPPA